MRDILIVAVILISLPIGLMMPFYGLLVYNWISFMYPHMYAWSFGQSFPVAKLSAISALAGTFLAGAADFAPLRKRENIAMLMLWGMFTISTIFAFYPDAAWMKWQDASKVILMALLASTLLTTRKRLRYFFLLIAFSLGFYGLKGGIFSLATGGSLMVYGPGTSIISANNAIGLALNMCLPFMWYLAQDERGWLKRLLQVMFVFTMPAIMFTYSRASALTLPIVLLALMMKGKGKVFLAVIVLAGAVFATPYIPAKWWNRQETIISYQQDGSAMSRIDNWKLSWEIALDNPLTGGGFYFHDKRTFARYASAEFLSTYGDRAWDTHNIYLAILAGHGFPGFALFAAMILFSILSCRRMRKLVNDRPDMHWVRTYCNIITVSFLALLVNGTFVNMEYFDLVYDLVAVVASLRVICERAMAPAVTEEAELDRELIPVSA